MSGVKLTRHGQAANVRFDRPFLLLVEGGDDEALAVAQIAMLGDGSQWQVHNMGGNTTGWSPALAVVLDDEWFSERGAAVGLVMDADSDPSATLTRCLGILEANGLPSPVAPEVVATDGRRAGIYVMPGGGVEGALEELLVQSAEARRLAEAEAYLRRLEEAGLGAFEQPGKSLVQAYLAGQQRLTKTIVVGLKREEVFPPASACFEPFRAYLRGLAGEAPS